MKLVILILCIILKLPTFIGAGEEQIHLCDCDCNCNTSCSSWILDVVKPFVTEPIQVAALGRTASLGDFYNARNDQFMGISLYTSELPRDAISSIDLSLPSFNYVKTESIKEKFQKLEIETSLSTSFLAGLIRVSGSGKYLHQDKKSAKSAKTSLVYRIKTISDNLKIFSKSSRSVMDFFLLENVDATHVVVGIEWGANVVLSLEETKTDPYNYQDVQRKLEATLDEILLIVTNSSNIDREKYHVENSTTFSVHLNADILPNTVPQTINKSIAFIRNIPHLIKTKNDGKGAILNYILMPVQTVRKLLQVETNNTGIVNEIDPEITDQFFNIFQEIEDSELLIKDMYDLFHSFDLMVPEKEMSEIKDFTRKFFSLGNVFRKRFANVVVLFRGGTLYDTSLSELVSAYERSNYTLASVKKFLDGYRTTMHKIQLLNLLQSYNVSFVNRETDKYEIIERSNMQEIYLISADLSNVSSRFVNDLINLVNAESEGQSRGSKYYIEDVSIKVSEIKVYSGGKIRQAFSCDEKISHCFHNFTKIQKFERKYSTDKKEYIFLKDFTGTLIIVDGSTLNTIRFHNLNEIAKSLVAIIDDTFYNIDTKNGIIKSTEVKNIMNGSDAVLWTDVGSFTSDANPIYNGVAVNETFIYFVTYSGILYLCDTTFKKVNKIGNIESGDSYASLVVVDGNLYIHKYNKFYSSDGAAVKQLTPQEVRIHSGLFQLGSLVCRVGGNNTKTNPDPVSCYNPSGGAWTVISHINQHRRYPGITSTESGTYIFGGSDWSNNWLDSVEVFKPKCKIWSTIPSPLSNKPQYVQAVAFYY